jgi:predicted secreted protein
VEGCLPQADGGANSFMIQLSHIARFVALAVLLLLLQALAPARAQNVVNQGETSTLAVQQEPGDTYLWELYSDSTVNFAKIAGDCPPAKADFVGSNTGTNVNVQWKEPGTYFYKVTAYNITGCTSNLRVGKMKVIPSLPKAHLKINPEEICVDDPDAELLVTIKGKAPWNMILQIEDLASGKASTVIYSDIDAADNPFKIVANQKATSIYTIIEISNIYGVQTIPSNSVTLTVHPLPKSTPIYLKK